jgi:hypothetical protein
MQLSRADLQRRIRTAVRKTVGAGLVLYLTLLTFGVGPVLPRGRVVSESEAPQQSEEGQTGASVETLALPPSARRIARCMVSQKLPARARILERFATREFGIVGHRLANGLRAPLRC